jgi:hypothetical protein
MLYFYGRFGTERKGLATIHGILTAVGEILGGIIFGMLGHRFTGRLGPERSKTETRRESPRLALLAGAHTDIFAGEGGSGYVTVVSWQDC